MSALADELLADLEGLSEGEDEYKEEEQDAQAEAGPSNGLKRKAPVEEDEDEVMSEGGEEAGGEDNKKAIGSLVLEGGIKPAEELDAEEVQRMELGAVEDVRKVAKLYGSKRMNDILKVCCTAGLGFAISKPFERKLTSTKPIQAHRNRCHFLRTRIQNTISSSKQITSL
jgi:hypothetical protein